MQSCTVQSMEWLGANQADKSCNCAFDRLTKDDQFIGKVLGSMGAGGDDINFEKWGFDFVEPCLPKQFPAETDNAFVKECLKAGDVNKATCECVLKSIKKDYTVVSPKVIACLVGAILYLIKKKDLVSDNIPIVGHVDDLAVMGLALKLSEKELKAFSEWRKAQMGGTAEI